jgi:hypothetical protein
MPLSGAEQVMIVAAGVVLTLLLGGALLHWIDQEWRKLDVRQRRGSSASSNSKVENETEFPPSDPASRN